ncbi:hypothetical protein [Egbenema bharatensis]
MLFLNQDMKLTRSRFQTWICASGGIGKRPVIAIGNARSEICL